MPEYLDDPSVLTKDKLKSELVANNVDLPSGEQKKDIYVQLYLKNLTVQNKKTTLEAFSSDEELAPSLSNKTRSGRKATKKTDKPRLEDLDASELTDEALKDELLKYGVNAGPIVASTRKLYERKLQKLLGQGPPEAITLPVVVTEIDGNLNGNNDADRYSDKEEEVTTVPEPEPEPVPVPVVERSTRSRGKTPVTTRTRSSQHYRTIEPGHTYDAQEEEMPILNIKRHPRRSSLKWDQAVPASDDTDVSDLSAAELPPSSLAPLIHPRDAKSKTDPESTIPCSLKEKSIALQPRDSARKPLIRGPPESQKVPESPRSCSPWKTVSKLKEKDSDLPSTDVKLIKAPSREPVTLFNTAILEEPEQNVDDSEIRKASISQNAIDPLRCAPRGCSPLLASKLAKRPTPSLAGSDPFTFSPVRHISSSPKSLKQQGPPPSPLAKFDLLSDRFSWKNQHMPMAALKMPIDRQPKASPLFTRSQNHGCVTMVSKESGVEVEKIAAAEQHTEVEEKDVLKQMFSNEITTPTGLSATCRRPIRGAAGRPVKSSDLWSNDSLLCAPRETSTTTSTSSSYIENHSVRRVSSLPNSSRLAVPPAGKIRARQHGMAVWLQLLLLAVVAGFVFFVYQTMETNAINPFGGSESKPIDNDNAGQVVNK